MINEVKYLELSQISVAENIIRSDERGCREISRCKPTWLLRDTGNSDQRLTPESIQTQEYIFKRKVLKKLSHWIYIYFPTNVHVV